MGSVIKGGKKQPSVFKLHLHRVLFRGLGRVPMSYLAVKWVQQVAALADPMLEIVEAVRSRRFDEALPGLPDAQVWRVLHRDHRAVTAGLGEALPGFWGMDGGEVQEVLDLGREVSAYEREKPGRLARWMVREIGPAKLLR